MVDQLLFSVTSAYCFVVQIVRQSGADQVTIIGACVTLVEALKAADELATAGINVRVIDPFTIKPIDMDTILKSARQTGGRLVIVEDHYPEGSIGSCVLLCFLRNSKDSIFLVLTLHTLSFWFSSIVMKLLKMKKCVINMLFKFANGVEWKEVIIAAITDSAIQ